MDGLSNRCKKCEIEVSKERQRNHKEERQEYDKQRLKNNPDYFRNVFRRYAKRHDEKIKKRVHDWRQNNQDKISYYNEKRRNTKKHIINEQEWSDCKRYFDNSCAYCGMNENDHIEKYKTRLHKEHVDDTGSNDLSNCVPACVSCNSSKRNYTISHWYNEKNPVYSQERLKLINQWLDKDYLKYIKQINKI